MERSEWYKLQDVCRRENASETVKNSNVLVCKKFGGSCSMIKCINAHGNTK